MTDVVSRLLDAVLADPGEDTPRLVLADALEEAGEGDRAEFIRVQIELALDETLDVSDWPLDLRDQHQARNEAFRLLERRLMSGRNVQQWFDGPWFDGHYAAIGLAPWVGVRDINEGARYEPPPLMRVCFRRGFVEAVRCSWEGWLRHGPAVVRAQPVTRVMVGGFDEPDGLHSARALEWARAAQPGDGEKLLAAVAAVAGVGQYAATAIEAVARALGAAFEGLLLARLRSDERTP